MGAAAIPLMMAGGTAVGMYSSIRAGEQQSRNMREEAKLLEAQERQTAAEGAQKLAAQQRAARKVLGEQRAAMAQNLGGSTYGTSELILESYTMAELDAMNLEYETQNTRQGLLYQAKQLKRGAREAKTAGYVGALGTGMSGAAQAGYMRSTLKAGGK